MAHESRNASEHESNVNYQSTRGWRFPRSVQTHSIVHKCNAYPPKTDSLEQMKGGEVAMNPGSFRHDLRHRKNRSSRYNIARDNNREQQIIH